MISLVIPTYNERQNITELVDRTGKVLAAGGHEFELIVVDDASPDGTANEIRSLQGDRPWLRLLVREEERGLATAVLAGWRMARGEILACMDGDLQHPPEDLARLVERQNTTGADIVVASRHVADGGVSEWKLRRRVISWSATTLAGLLLRGRLHGVRDPMSGFFVLKRAVIDAVALKPVGYKILLEVLTRGRYRHVEEVPYTFQERPRGGSKMGFAQACLYLVHLVRLAARPRS